MIEININWLLLLKQVAPWGIPLLAGFVILLVGPFLKKSHRFSFILSLAAILFSLWLALENWTGATGETTGLFLFDKFTYLFVILFLLSGVFTILISYNYLESFGLVRPEYYVLILFSLFGMGCMAAGHDLMVVFLGLEIMSVSVYVLAGFQRTNTLCVEASLKYFLMGAFASSFLLLGIAFIYGAAGTTDLIALHQMGIELITGPSRTFALIGLALLGVGLGFKIAVVPFHYWAADVYEGAPVIVTNFMATGVKAAAFAALLRVVWALFQWEPAFLTHIVWIAAALTMTLGNVAALLQRNLKRMLAYSSIAHAGYALIPLVAYPSQSLVAVSSISFYLLAYILMTTGAFAILIALTNSSNKEQCNIQDLAGLGMKKPFLGFAMTILMLSLAGIPPTMGFFGKYFLFSQAVQAGFIWLVVIAVLNSVISVYYYLGPVVVMYFGKEEEASPKGSMAALPLGTLTVIWITALSILFFGLFPNTLLDFVRLSASSWALVGN